MPTKHSPEKKEKKKKPMTLDDFAAAIQGDYMALSGKITAVSEEMATLRNEMATHKHLLEVHDDVKRLNKIMVSKADLEEAIQRKLDTSPYAKDRDLTDLRLRMRRVEEKLGMKASDRAA